jgi:hypothetical protein
MSIVRSWERDRDGDVDVFHLPGTSDHPNITLSGGIYATAFDDRPAVMAAMAYQESPEPHDYPR